MKILISIKRCTRKFKLMTETCSRGTYKYQMIKHWLSKWRESPVRRLNTTREKVVFLIYRSQKHVFVSLARGKEDRKYLSYDYNLSTRADKISGELS